MDSGFSINADGAKKLDLKDLPKLEEDIGFKLPKEYIEWMSNNAGGFLSPFGVFSDVGVSGILPIYPTEHSKGISERYGFWSESENDEVIPIAEGPTGDAITIKVKGDDIGSIWVEQGGDSRRLADNFSQFIKDLKPYETK